MAGSVPQCAHWGNRYFCRRQKCISSPATGTRKKDKSLRLVLFSVKSTLRVGEILLRSVKSGLHPGEIAAAVGGFYFTENRRLSISPKAEPLISPFAWQRISRNKKLSSAGLCRKQRPPHSPHIPELPGRGVFCLRRLLSRHRMPKW